ncbi:MAG: 2-oxoacid:acceptor oxidoreductase family protein [Deltaproteobacteria bacterium]|nr:2-oxoacid:acceptor oxidoreductase family protein [Deltaproteobacteria bacterium]
MSKELLKKLGAGETIDVRADGKAGSGLVMILQTFAEAVSLKGDYQVQEWPFFSSARKGANVRGYLRIGKGPTFISCKVDKPHLALLVSEKTGEELDFASGMNEGIYLINSPRSPAETADSFHLRGLVYTIPGDQLGEKYLGRPLPNIPLLAAMQTALPLVSSTEILKALEDIGRKRRLPEKMIEANKTCFLESLKLIRREEIPGDPSWKHPLPPFEGYLDYPTGAQSRLRTSLSNQTANYARPGRRLVFHDPENRCNGCSLCIVNCPEGIIQFEKDEKQGVRVTGANIDQFCKLCRECIEVCPIDLFEEVGC